MLRLALNLILVSISVVSFAQANYWQKSSTTFSQKEKALLNTTDNEVFQLNESDFQKALDKVTSQSNPAIFQPTTQINLPLPNGKLHTFKIREAAIMAPDLAKKFPEIKTYQIQDVDNKLNQGRIDFSPKGLRGFIKTLEGSVFIDPIEIDGQRYYQSFFPNQYQLKDGEQIDLVCEQIKEEGQDYFMEGQRNRQLKTTQNAIGTEMRTYRLAVAGHHSFTNYHGGTVEDGLFAIVTIINRLVAVTEIELSIRFELVANNNAIIFIDPDNDPYEGATFLNANTDVLNEFIGADNYDIGHVLSGFAGGGQASRGSVCRFSKASGYSGRGWPLSSARLLEVVSHEFGHQLGAAHVFNGDVGSCSDNRSANNAYEPGSGSTILSYAGFCSTQRLQSFNDFYFNNASFNSIIDYMVFGQGNDCAVITDTQNNIPIIEMDQTIHSIPISTAFELTGAATDMDGDSLTYCWEQHDLGPAGHPNEPEGNAPLFRSWQATNNPTRTFPRLGDLLNNTTVIGEILPDYQRDMTFRFTVRDNNLNGGAVNSEEVKLKVAGNAGPFLVLYPNENESIVGGKNIEVTWDEANTNSFPVLCDKVDILLSLDGGFTFPIVLAEAITNDGAQTVAIPNSPTDLARIKISCSSNVFFDLSNENFEILPATDDFSLSTNTLSSTICESETLEVIFEIDELNNSGEVVTLEMNPELGDYSFNPATGIPPFSSILTVANLAVDTLAFEIEASSISEQKKLDLDVVILPNQFEEIVGFEPMDNATEVSFNPTLSWNPIPGVEKYLIQISTTSDFSTIFQEVEVRAPIFSDLTLDWFTRYYWRVIPINSCSIGEASETYSFLTTEVICETFNNSDLEVIGMYHNPTMSEIPLPVAAKIRTIEIVDLVIRHEQISNATIFLESPSLEKTTLFYSECDINNITNTFNFSADGQNQADWPCPIAETSYLSPIDPFNIHYKEQPIGDWNLIIEDTITVTPFTILQTWSLEICYVPFDCDYNLQVDSSNISCHSTSDGFINLSADRQLDSVIWDHGAVGQNIGSLPAGNYSANIYYNRNCTDFIQVELTAPTALELISESIDSASCAGYEDGAICLSAQGATTPYIFNWQQNNLSGPKITDLAAGTYNIRVIDSNGCELDSSFTIHEPDPITINLLESSISSDDNGVIHLQPIGGIAPYDISWFSEGMEVGFGEKIVGLSPGIYSAVILDANECEFITQDFVLIFTGSNDLIATQFSLYPNPMQNIALLNFGNEKRADYEIEIVNIIGQTVTNRFELRSIHESLLELESMAKEAGLFYLRIKAKDGGEITIPIIIHP